MLHNLFQSKREREKFPSSFSKVLLISVTKLNQHNTRKKNYSSISFMNIYVKILGKIPANSVVL